MSKARWHLHCTLFGKVHHTPCHLRVKIWGYISVANHMWYTLKIFSLLSPSPSCYCHQPLLRPPLITTMFSVSTFHPSPPLNHSVDSNRCSPMCRQWLQIEGQSCHHLSLQIKGQNCHHLLPQIEGLADHNYCSRNWTLTPSSPWSVTADPWVVATTHSPSSSCSALTSRLWSFVCAVSPTVVVEFAEG